MSWLLPAAAGLVCGIVSGFGIGGGTILMLWLTAVAGFDQRAAQGINLLYFLPTALASSLLHAKAHRIDWHAVLPAALAGCGTAALFSWIAMGLEVGLLKKLFGGFLLIVGLSELLKK